MGKKTRMKKILGLDLGTNSIGWAVVNVTVDKEGKEQPVGIEASGCRIIPMDAATLGNFNAGKSVSQTANRTRYRGARRLRERHLLRRTRLHRVLDILGFLPGHYSENLDRYGKMLTDVECKLPWRRNATGAYEFLFKDSFNEMLADFAGNNPEWVANGKKIPYDWTIFYLRNKALTKKIAKEELAWILLNFNQKRGYYQLRGEEDVETPNKEVKIYALKVEKVVANTENKKSKKTYYDIYLENGMIYHYSSSVFPDWEGKVKEFIVTTDLNPDGTPKKGKDGSLKRSFSIPKEEDDWMLIKKKTEEDIEQSGKTVGTYIYETLLRKPDQKIRGRLVRVVERRFYKDELRQILDKQMQFHAELRDASLYDACLRELYSSNHPYRDSIANRDFSYLLIDNIIFYQRPLKSKKALIDNCPYEENTYIDKKTGEIKHAPVKCIAKSHPLYQEFRLWQFVSNLRIYQRERMVQLVPDTDSATSATSKLEIDADVTCELLPTEADYVALFEWLNDKKEIKQNALLKYPRFGLKSKTGNYRWNYVEDKSYPCNETHALLLENFAKLNIPTEFLTREKEEALWHILYSVEDKQEIRKALQTFAGKNGLGDEFVELFVKCPPFKKEYGAYSGKAIKKLLPLMRMGKYWSAEAIDENTVRRIERIVNKECDESIRERVRQKAITLTDISCFHSLPLWLACYVVYDRHSEVKDIVRWNTPEEIDSYLKSFKQHSLRNPIVEQVVTETLRTVRDIWKQVGRIDEIHVELGREMKNPADKRAKLMRQILDNENRNLRIKALLTEFLNPEFGIENVRPYSPSQQDLLRIYEEDALSSASVPEEIEEILDKFSQSDVKKRPTRSEILRYKCWLEQKYRSPYTNEIIPLAKLFTPAYEIEHIIPKVRYFDDSFNNKVICETEVNRVKEKMLGYEFIKKQGGEIVELSFGRKVKISSVESYEKFVKEHYSHNRNKMRNLLMEDIPETFIKRQLNDTRYISRLVKSILSNVVRKENEQEAISNNVITCTGDIVARLKKDWGMNDVWNKIILPRFLRMDKLTGKTQFTSFNTHHELIPVMPLGLQKGFNKKRIDHRHHAMDAIVIACANRNIVNYLNNASASRDAEIKREDLQRLLCRKTKTDENGNYKWVLNKPWGSFTQDVLYSLQNIIISFKQNLRVTKKTTNYYQRYEDGKKICVPQSKGDGWTVRKPMHKEFVYGEVNLRKIKTVSLNEAIRTPQMIVEKSLKRKIGEMLRRGFDAKEIKKYFEKNETLWKNVNPSKIEVYYFTMDTRERYFAIRKPVDTSFDEKKIRGSVTDTGIQQIMLRHLESKENNPALAFSPDGIDEMNRNITALNNGKERCPIYKVRFYEKANKFAVGEKGNKQRKFVEAAQGTNLFFAIYEKEVMDRETGGVVYKRNYTTIPLNEAFERQKQGIPVAPGDEYGNPPKYVISPNDLVYVPTPEEIMNNTVNTPISRDRIYRFVNSNETTANFIPCSTADLIYAQPKEMAKNYCSGDVIQNEYGVGSSQSKNQLAVTGEMIKDICLPLTVDRLGNIIKIGNMKVE